MIIVSRCEISATKDGFPTLESRTAMTGSSLIAWHSKRKGNRSIWLLLLEAFPDGVFEDILRNNVLVPDR